MPQIILIFLLLAWGSPHLVIAQKKQFKSGLDQESKGNIIAAIDQYKAALYRDMHYENARNALDRCARKHVDKLLMDLFVQVESGELAAAEVKAKSIAIFQEELAYFDIELKIPDYQKKRISNISLLKAEHIYKKALNMYQNENLEGARNVILEAANDEVHQPSRSLLIEIEVALLTRKVSVYLDAYQYFKAHQTYMQLDSLNGENVDYRTSINQIIRDHGMTVGILDISNSNSAFSSSLKSSVSSKIVDWANPLVKVVEREELNLLLEEQKQYYSGFFEQNSCPSAGNLKGISHILLIKLENIRISKSPVKSISVSAYKKIKQKIYSPQGNWRIQAQYIPISYSETHQTSTVEGTVHFRMIETETGLVTAAGKSSALLNDQVCYRQYNGDHNTLFPARDGEIIISGKYLRQFRNSFDEPVISKSHNQLFLQLEANLSQKTISKIRSILMEQ